jgi:hypothetical protein
MVVTIPYKVPSQFHESIFPPRTRRDGIFTSLWSPGIDSNESIPPACVPDGPVQQPISCSRFLAPIDCYQIPAPSKNTGTLHLFKDDMTVILLRGNFIHDLGDQ